jgi:hypothetical protein
MEIRIRATGAVVYEGEFRSMHPNTTFPQTLTAEVLDDAGADPVLEGPQASPTRYQTAYRDGVEEINGQWFTKYSVADLDAEGIAAVDAAQATAMRNERSKRLAETVDTVNAIRWAAMSEEQQTAWTNYRNALLDVPEQSGFPFEINWPTTPN